MSININSKSEGSVHQYDNTPINIHTADIAFVILLYLLVGTGLPNQLVSLFINMRPSAEQPFIWLAQNAVFNTFCLLLTWYFARKTFKQSFFTSISLTKISGMTLASSFFIGTLCSLIQAIISVGC